VKKALVWSLSLGGSPRARFQHNVIIRSGAQAWVREALREVLCFHPRIIPVFSRVIPVFSRGNPGGLLFCPRMHRFPTVAQAWVREASGGGVLCFHLRIIPVFSRGNTRCLPGVILGCLLFYPPRPHRFPTLVSPYWQRRLCPQCLSSRETSVLSTMGFGIRPCRFTSGKSRGYRFTSYRNPASSTVFWSRFGRSELSSGACQPPRKSRGNPFQARGFTLPFFVLLPKGSGQYPSYPPGRVCKLNSVPESGAK
jgi:hypothetical protein